MTGAIVPSVPAWRVDVAPAGPDAVYIPHADGHYRLTGGFLSAPSAAAFNGADTSAIVLASADAYNGPQQALLAHWGASPNRSFMMRTTTVGHLEADVSATGSAFVTGVGLSSSPVDGTRYWWREDRDHVTGIVSFYVADGEIANPTDDDWVLLSSTAIAAGSAPASVTASLLLGGQGVEPPSTTPSNPLTGNMYRAIFSVNGVVVASPDFRHAAGGEASFVDGQGNVWTPHGAAAVVAEVAEFAVGRVTLASALLTVQSAPVVAASAPSGSSGGGGPTPPGTGTSGLGLDWIATGGLDTFHAALLAKNADIVLFGNSITEGSLATSEQNRWAHILLDRVRADFQPAGVTGGEGLQLPWNNTGAAGWDPWTRSGGVETSDTGLAYKGYKLNTVGARMRAATLTFDELDIYYRQLPGGGLVDIDVDGTVTTVDMSGPDLAGRKVTVTGPPGAHAVTITNVSGVNVIEIQFRYLGDRTSGIRLWAAGHGGGTVKLFATNFDRAVPTLTSIPHPAIVIIELVINDYSSGRSPGQAVSNLNYMVAKIRANLPNDPSIVVWNMWQSPFSTWGIPWDTYAQALYDWVRADGKLCMFDARARIGDYGEFYVDGHTIGGNSLFSSAAADFTGVAPGSTIRSDFLVGGANVFQPGTSVASVIDAHSVELSAPAVQSATGQPFTLVRTPNPLLADGLHPDDDGHLLLGNAFADLVLP